MTTSIRFYRDQFHRPRVDATREYAALADYLEGDIQETITASEVLALLPEKAEDQQEIHGNSYTVILKGDQITLESLFDDEQAPDTLPLAQFQQLLIAWSDFLDQDNLISIVPDF